MHENMQNIKTTMCSFNEVFSAVQDNFSVGLFQLKNFIFNYFVSPDFPKY